MRVLIGGAVVVLALVACGGQPDAPGDDGGADLDAFVEETDAGTDAGGPADAGDDSGGLTDAGDDSGAVDAAVLLDAGAADSGAPDAGTPDGGPERCSAEGMYRTAACACEGTLSQRCAGGVWTDVTACSATPACAPDAFETRNGFQCSVQQRVCGDDCQWGDWVVVVEMGECYPGTSECSVFAGIECRCTATCTCEPIPECPVIP